MDNNLGMTSEIKLFTGPCLGCCSAMQYPNHSYSRGQKVRHWLRKQFLEEGLLKKCNFSGTCFCFILMQTGRHPPHTPVALVQLRLVCYGAPGERVAHCCPGELIMSLISIL